MSPYPSHAALQIFSAFQNVTSNFYGRKLPPAELSFRWERQLHNLWGKTVKSSSGLAQVLESGHLPLRGLLSDEVSELVGMLKKSKRPPFIQLMAMMALGRLLSAKDSLLHPSAAVILRESLLAHPDALELLLDTQTQVFQTVDPNELRLAETPLGRGITGAVYSATWNGKRVAVKKLSTEPCPELYREFNIMSLLSHPYIIGMYGGAIPEVAVGVGSAEPPFCVMELAECGSLFQVLQQGTPETIAMVVRNCPGWLFQVAQAIDYLHHNNILHRDLKSLNVVLTESYLIAKLTDYGHARLFSSIEMSSHVGTCPWMAPEVSIEGVPYSFSADIWSFGMLTYEILTARIPYDYCKTGPAVTTEVLAKKLPPLSSTHYSALPSTLRRSLETIYRSCVRFKPSKRPATSQLIRSIISACKPPEG